MKIWYAVITVIVSVAYVTNAVNAMRTADMCMERYAYRKHDKEVVESLQNEDDFDDEDFME